MQTVSTVVGVAEEAVAIVTVVAAVVRRERRLSAGDESNAAWFVGDAGADEDIMAIFDTDMAYVAGVTTLDAAVVLFNDKMDTAMASGKS